MYHQYEILSDISLSFTDNEITTLLQANFIRLKIVAILMELRFELLERQLISKYLRQNITN